MIDYQRRRVKLRFIGLCNSSANYSCQFTSLGGVFRFLEYQDPVFVFYLIHFEITSYPCNLIGSQWCDLYTNRTIFCTKSHLFSQPMKMGQ